MLRTEGAFVDLKRTLHERLGLFETIGVLEESSEIVEVSGDIGVLRTEGAFVDLKRTSCERLGLFEAIGGFEELSEIVENRTFPVCELMFLDFCLGSEEDFFAFGKFGEFSE